MSTRRTTRASRRDDPAHLGWRVGAAAACVATEPDTRRKGMNGKIETRRFDAPDERLDMKERGGIRS